jgi:hypothetical protein
MGIGGVVDEKGYIVFIERHAGSQVDQVGGRIERCTGIIKIDRDWVLPLRE